MGVTIINADTVDEQDEEKVAAYLSAGSLKKSDITEIINSFSKPFYDCDEPIFSLKDGESFSAAKSAFEKVCENLALGKPMLFVMKNDWLSNAEERNKYVTSSDASQSAETKKLVCELFDFVKSNENLFKSLNDAMRLMLVYEFENTFRVFRAYKVMGEMATAEVMRDFSNSFEEFDALYKKYNKESIYDEVPVNKAKYNLEENTAIAKEYLGADIAATASLSKFIVGPGRITAWADNQTRLFDAKTKFFASLAKCDGEFKKAIEDMDKYLNRVKEPKNQSLAVLSMAVNHLLFALKEMFEDALDIIESFKKNADKAPYSVMHYTSTVESVASKYFLGSTDDAFKSGTNYKELVRSMTRQLESLAKNVAKAANDHYGSK